MRAGRSDGSPAMTDVSSIEMQRPSLDRRRFLTGSGLALAAASAPWAVTTAAAAPRDPVAPAPGR